MNCNVHLYELEKPKDEINKGHFMKFTKEDASRNNANTSTKNSGEREKAYEGKNADEKNKRPQQDDDDNSSKFKPILKNDSQDHQNDRKNLDSKKQK